MKSTSTTSTESVVVKLWVEALPREGYRYSVRHDVCGGFVVDLTCGNKGDSFIHGLEAVKLIEYRASKIDDLELWELEELVEEACDDARMGELYK